MKHLSLFLLSSLALLACGGNVSTGGTGASGGGTGASGGGGNVKTGDCETDADCNGGTCAEVTPGGYKVCLAQQPEVTACSQNPMFDECCASSDCMEGACYSNATLPYCGGPAMAEYNVCLSDACQTDMDCLINGEPTLICAPAGAFGYPVKSCATAYCRTNADCPGGFCGPVFAPCCNTFSALACVMPGGCQRDQDCSLNGEAHCEIEGGEGVCKPGPALCPA